MGLLDELKQTADKPNPEFNWEKTSPDLSKALALEHLQPKLKALYRYFNELAKQLQRVSPDVTVSYEVRGFGTLVNLRMKHYEANIDDPVNPRKVTFSVVCSGSQPRTLKAERDTLLALQEYLKAHRLRFMAKGAEKGVSALQLDANVPVVLEFEPILDKVLIRLVALNLDGIGVSTFHYEPLQVSEELMDEIGKRVLRKPNRFNELSGNLVSEDTRSRLKRVIHEGKRRKELELRGSSAPPGAAARKKKKKKRKVVQKRKSLGFFARLFSRRTRRS